jgi:flavin-dependent dehydrogenase
MSRVRDAVVVGGGPAGLAFAIAAAAAGHDVTVLERGAGPLDKACGEGLLPAGHRALEALGVLPLLATAEVSRLREIRWIEADGTAAHLALPAPGGLGIRRTALSAALRARALALGVELVEGAEVALHWREDDRIWAGLGGGLGAIPARLLVAADGLASPVRRREGLDRPTGAPPRFGIRRHYAIPPWAEAVEVHFAGDAEAYVTPVGARRVGVAILFEQGARVRFEDLLARFPALEAILGAAPVDSAVRGAGPFSRAARARVADRLCLLGDAAGYVDAVTGEGLSIAFGCALDLARLLPEVLARRATRAALAPYDAAWRRRFRPYAAWTRLVLALSRRPALRRRVLSLAASAPRPFERMVAAAVG